MILSRPSGIILRLTGGLFAPASTPALAASQDDDAPTTANGTTSMTSDLARVYAKLAVTLVDSVGAEVRGVEDGVRGALLPTKLKLTSAIAQDDLRFLRIRTKKHELMITPGELEFGSSPPPNAHLSAPADELYILVSSMKLLSTSLPDLSDHRLWFKTRIEPLHGLVDIPFPLSYPRNASSVSSTLFSAMYPATCAPASSLGSPSSLARR